jgi:PAS domain S-box-containing protein
MAYVEGSSAGVVHQDQQDFRLLVDSIVDYGIFMLDLQGIVLSWNAGAERMQGYTAQEIVGRHFSSFYPESDIKAGKPAMELRVAGATGRFEDEGWCLRKDGSRFWASAVVTALRDKTGVIRGFGRVTRDLSERRSAELQLKESEERFRLMVASVKDYAIIMLDPEGHIVSWNAGAERIKGWTAEEITGKSFNLFYPPEDIEAGKTVRELKEATESGAFEDYGWRVRKDGSRFWANVVITALRDATGRLRGFSKVTRDITDRKKSDESLRKAFEEMEAFSYSVSHDLRAPLRSMDGFSEELLEQYGGRLDERGKDYLIRIRQSAQRMARLIDDLLNLSRLGRAKVHKEWVDLSDLARKTVADLQRADPRRKVEVVIAPGMTARADPALIRVVLDNLIGNAWKYTSHHEAARIEVGFERKGGATIWFVRDDGAGFDMKYAPKLFGAFQRLHGSERFSGNGIGLASVKRIVNRHGGDISAVGAVEKGATFTFTLGA